MSARTTIATVAAPADRRLARSAATRTAVVDALLRLLEEGDLRPTAPRIAARAGVSLRSVFQHFADIEALFAAAADRQTERLRRLGRRLDGDGPFESRLNAFVAQRQRLLETLAPVRRAALLMEPFSAAIRTRLARARALGRAELRRVFAPELAALSAGERAAAVEAMAALSSFSGWEALRVHQGLSVSRAARVLARALHALLQRPAVDARRVRRQRPAPAARAASPRRGKT
jgi:AcrR family transcriptional regulator